MSDMEMFYGTFVESNVDLSGLDEDDIIDLEETNKCLYIIIDDKQYTVTAIKIVDPFGFTLVIPPSETTRIMCYWYNGGADVHEVLESGIRTALSKEQKYVAV